MKQAAKRIGLSVRSILEKFIDESDFTFSSDSITNTIPVQISIKLLTDISSFFLPHTELEVLAPFY